MLPKGLVFMVSTILNRISDRSFLSFPLSAHQRQIDRLVGTFTEEATNPRTLAAMVAGGAVFRLGKTAGLAGSAALLGSSESLLATAASRAFSNGAGFLGEAIAFEGTHRTLRVAAGEDASLLRWEGPNGLKAGLLHSGLSLGALKAGGHWARGENILIRHLAADSALVFAHQAGASLNLHPRPSGGLAEQFLAAEAANLPLLAGTRLTHGIFPRLSSVERALDFEIGIRSGKFRPFAFGWAAAATTGGAGTASLHLPPADPGWRDPLLAQMNSQPPERAGSREPRVAIVGGGASGTLTAVSLLKHAQKPVTVQIVEGASREIGRGTAYSTEDPGHLLNVPAGKLSAFPDDPGHFLRWAQGLNPSAAPTDFLSRRLYGQYLQEVLAQAEANSSQGVLLRAQDSAVDFNIHGTTRSLRLASGSEVPADHLVLALGNASPANPYLENPTFFSSSLYTQDPFLRGGAAYLNVDGPVLLLGTGLTMVDVALSIYTKGRSSNIFALSRRGRLPETHAASTPYASAEEVAQTYRGKNLGEILATLRGEIRKAEAQGSNWRAAVDALRPITNDLWRSLGEREKRQFLRHLVRLWDVHRHRMPPSSAQVVQGLIEKGRLTLAAGRLQSTEERNGGAEITFQPREDGSPVSLRVAHVVNCTGPDTNYLRLMESNPLIRSLLDQGLIRPDHLRLGLQTDESGALLSRSGEALPYLSTLGPPRKGNFWETTAIPEIRDQAERLSRSILSRLENGPR